MAESVEERLLQLESRCMAYELVLFDLIHDAWPLEHHRADRLAALSRAVEATFAQMGPSEHAYLHLQRVLAAAEELFSDTHRPAADEPRP